MCIFCNEEKKGSTVNIWRSNPDSLSQLWCVLACCPSRGPHSLSGWLSARFWHTNANMERLRFLKEKSGSHFHREHTFILKTVQWFLNFPQIYMLSSTRLMIDDWEDDDRCWHRGLSEKWLFFAEEQSKSTFCCTFSLICTWKELPSRML